MSRSVSTPPEVIDWLLAGDPAIRWQTMRDLCGESETAWRAVQSRVATEGWGARLLVHQDAAGRWTPRLYGKKWISTTYSMVLLRRMGLPRGHPAALSACGLFLDEGLWRDGGINISATLERSETCVTGMVLALLSWFGYEDVRNERLLDYLLDEQMDDGGWNCQRHAGATHGSFHTTISVLEGLREYAAAGGERTPETARAEASAREFLALHHLYRSHRTGAVADPKMTRLSFPPRWHHDILRGLDYFQAAAAPPDLRLEDPIRLLMGKCRSDGRWPLQQRYAGATWFEMESVGEPSRWNTLRALRVLRWWNGRDAQSLDDPE